MKIIVELSTTGMLDCWDIWYELSFGRASPILFGRRSKKPNFMSQYFLQQRRRMRRRKISFSKRAFVSKMLRISSQITSSYIIAYSCPVYLLLYHSSLLWWFFKNMYTMVIFPFELSLKLNSLFCRKKGYVAYKMLCYACSRQWCALGLLGNYKRAARHSYVSKPQ